MARLAIGFGIGMVAAVVGMAALGSHAEGTEPDADTIALANAAGVEPIDLLGAANTVGVSPADYLAHTCLDDCPTRPLTTDAAVDHAPPIQVRSGPPPPTGWPIGGALGQRILCIEGIESHHGAAMWNPTPVGREHAQGFLGWLPSTARSVGVVIGNRASEWAGAARMLASGRGREFYGVAAGIC